MFLSDIQLLCNEENYADALKLLNSNGQNISDNRYYCFWYGFILYCLHRENDALPFFEQAQKLGLEAVDETPGYYPKSVSKWIERARIWSPRRIEKNKFEADRRAKRCKSSLNEGLSNTVLAGLWNNCDYSFEMYVGHTPTDADLSEIETELNYRFPESYKYLIKYQNGGHDMIFLDYSDCGNLGEPCVVHVNQENDYEITYLADNFAAFIQGLISYDKE